MATTAPKCRLFAILARNARRAVIFRRGPSKQVQLCLWHTDTDRVEEGQWLRGRVYERRCDLSPDGTKLVYFAAQWRKPLASWTAISTPPWWTAHALWPNGSAWGGGGLWDDDHSLAINTIWKRTEEMPNSTPPRGVKVRAAGGGGEDAPIWDARLRRDGWRNIRYGRGRSTPIEWARTSPTDAVELRMHIHGIGERGDDWYVVEHRVVRGDDVLLDLGRAEWADWDRSGDLLYAHGGVMHRLRRGVYDAGRAKVVIDLRDRRFEARPAPYATGTSEKRALRRKR